MSRWKPNSGGLLTMLNCALCLLLVALAREFPNRPDGVDILLDVSLFTLSLPFAWWFLLPVLDPSVTDIITRWVIFGANSFVWGYGLAAIIRRCRRLASRSTSPRADMGVVTDR